MLHNMRVLAVGDHIFIISKMSKTSYFKSRHFINIYIINRTSQTSERYFQHEKINLVSPSGHVISSIYYIDRSVLLENTPLVKFIRNYIHDPSVFSISSLLRILMTSLPAFAWLFVQTVSEKL